MDRNRSRPVIWFSITTITIRNFPNSMSYELSALAYGHVLVAALDPCVDKDMRF